MKSKQLLCLMLILLFAGCNTDTSFNSHTFRLISSYNHPEGNLELSMMDIKGDDSYFLGRIFSENKQSNSLLLLARGEKPLSQINEPNADFKNMKVLRNPQDGTNTLFYSSNNGKYVILRAENYIFSKPLTRISKVFEPYWRNDNLMQIPAYKWQAHLVPLFFEDIDGDGKLEVVVSAHDNYSANPRGLLAYDYETGKQKWFLKSPANFAKVIFEDLDNDGHKEFFISTVTFRNTSESINGIDDNNGFVVVANRFGEVQICEKVMDGTGEVKIQAEDLNQDGKKDLMVLTLCRGSDSLENKLIHFKYTGKNLVRVKDLVLSGDQENLYYPDFLFRLDRTNEYKILLKEQSSGLQLYDADFNQVQSGLGEVEALLYAGDFLGDGRKQLLFVDKTEHLVLLNNKLKPIAKMPCPEPGTVYLKTELFKPGNRHKPILMVGTVHKTLFYEIAHISLPLYIFNWVKANALWLCIALLMIIFHLLSVIHFRKKSLQQIVNTSERGFIILNAKMRIIYINKRGLAMSCQIDGTTKLRNLREAFPALVEPFQRLMLSGANHEETRVSLGIGDCKVIIERLSALRRIYMMLLSPLSREADYEMLAWADTARRLSHHVRRHITNVVLSLDYLDEGATRDSLEYLQIVRSEIDKIRIFTHAFQRFTEMSSLDLKLIDIVPHVEHTLEQARIGNNIKLIKSFGAQSIHAYIEPVRFEEALLNTINNATEAMPEGGSLHVSIRAFLKHSSPKGNLSILVEVEDSGKGIPAKYMQDIWMPFFTTNQSGTGIGIPETKKILDSMGGILDIQSEEGVGTTVSLWLKGETDG